MNLFDIFEKYRQEALELYGISINSKLPYANKSFERQLKLAAIVQSVVYKSSRKDLIVDLKRLNAVNEQLRLLDEDFDVIDHNSSEGSRYIAFVETGENYRSFLEDKLLSNDGKDLSTDDLREWCETEYNGTPFVKKQSYPKKMKAL